MYFLFSLLIILIYPHNVKGQLTDISEYDSVIRRVDMIADIIRLNIKENGWCTLLFFGNFPNELYIKLQNVSYPFAITNIDREDEELDDVVPHHSNTIIINLEDIEQYEDTILKIIHHPNWHPHSNVILYYHQQDHDILAKLFFSMWYYRAINAIIIQYDDIRKFLIVSHYNPYMSDDYKLDYLYGCWTTRRIGMPVSSFENGFACEEQCHNVSLNSKLRRNHLGTCIGFSKIIVPYNDCDTLNNLKLFEDKSKNFHGYSFRAFVTEVKPLFLIEDLGNGTYSMHSRDGYIWNTMSKLMNFTIDFTPSASVMKQPFNFELNIRQIFDFAYRKADLFLIPIYLFDVAVVELDYSFPYKESGVCIMSHRAGFKTTIFDVDTLHANRNVIAESIICFLCIWVTFSLYQSAEKLKITFDQIGKDLLNALRNVLLITLYNPPQRETFRIFLTISIWGCFVLNFATQATIVSFLTAAKRGKDVDTFEDMIEKGYLFYGMASPDLILPDTEERFRIINSRLVSMQDLFACIANMTTDVKRFCLIDCAVGRYLERNQLNEEGEQYLHIAVKDRMHSHYLTLLLTKHSPLTERFNRFLSIFYEAGLIKKWEQYRYATIKEEPLTKPLGMEDFKGLFNFYMFAACFIFFIFIMELLIFYGRRFQTRFLKKCKIWKRVKKLNRVRDCFKTKDREAKGRDETDN